MKENRKKPLTRLKLTILFSGIAFTIIFIVWAVVFAIASVLISAGVLELGDNLPSLKENFTTVVLISVVIGFVSSFSTSSFTISPINKVISGMNSLAAGDYKVRINFKPPFGKMKISKNIENSFNSMASELQKTEMLRSDFVNNFSHEFKTPIVSIAGFAKLLKHGDLTPEQQKLYIDIIEEESMRLSNMATNVLTLAKIENQVIVGDVNEFNISEQIRHCVLLLESKWAKKDIEFIVDFDEYNVLANEEMLKQVWINLIDNAIKFTPEKGKIEIDLIKSGKNVAVSVINIGETIPQEKMSRIFNKFYQGDESHAGEGNGIGLAVVKHIVELHHGRVYVKSQNGITEFKVTMPVGV